MSTRTTIAYLLVVALSVCACQTAEEAFVGERLQNLCDETYVVCGKPAGCVMNRKDYVEGHFPGANRHKDYILRGQR